MLRYDWRVNDIQTKLSELQGKGWTITALADELGNHVNTLEKWKAGHSKPSNSRSVFMALDTLLKRRPPKQRRYPGTHHLQRANKEQKRQDQV